MTERFPRSAVPGEEKAPPHPTEAPQMPDEWDAAILGKKEDVPLQEPLEITPPWHQVRDEVTRAEALFEEMEILKRIAPQKTPERQERVTEGERAIRGVEEQDTFEEQVARIEAMSPRETAPVLFGIKPEELSLIPGFDALSSGQKLLVFENLKQVTLARVKEESSGRYKKSIADEAAQGGLWRRVWQGMRESVLKPYKMLKMEKSVAEELKEGGMALHGDVLKEIVRVAKNGPEVLVKENGELEFLYVPTNLAEFSPEDKEKTDAFNQAATALAKIPDEWKYDTASGRQRRSYAKAKEQYDAARGEVLQMLSLSHKRLGEREESAERKEMLFVDEVDAAVRMNQYFNTHPDVEKELARIEQRGFWGRAWEVAKSVGAERGGYFAGGYLTRAVSTAAFGLYAAPLVAAGIGGIRARQRAAGSLRERARAARRGEKDTSATARNMVSAAMLKSKIDALTKRLGEVYEETPSDAQKRLAVSLAARLEYTMRKIDDGRVNFGGEKERMKNQYELLDTLGHSYVALEGETTTAKDILNKRLERFLGFKERNLRMAERNYKNREFARGALVSAGFAAAGYLIRDFFSPEQVLTHETEKAGEGVEKAVTGFGAALYQGRNAMEQFFAGSPEEVEQWFGGFSGDEYGPPTEEAVTKIAEEDLTFASDAGELSLPEIEGASVFEKNLEYQGGKSIWEESGKQLEKRFGEFAALGEDAETSEALKTWNIDRLKNTIVASPTRYGIPPGATVDALSAEQLKKIKWDDVFADTFSAEGGLTADLPPEKIAKIVGNNQTLREFFRAHPTTPRTSENYEAILRGSGGNTGEISAPPLSPPEETISRRYGPEKFIVKEKEILTPEAKPPSPATVKPSPSPEETASQRYGPEKFIVKEKEILTPEEPHVGQTLPPEASVLRELVKGDMEELQRLGLPDAEPVHVEKLLMEYDSRLNEATARLETAPWESPATRGLAKEAGSVIQEQLDAAKTAQEVAGSSFLLGDGVSAGAEAQSILSRGKQYEEASRRIFESVATQSERLVGDKTISPEAKVPMFDELVLGNQRRLFSLELAKNIKDQGQILPHLDAFVARDLPRAQSAWERTFDVVSENNRDIKAKYLTLREFSEKQEELIERRDALLQKVQSETRFPAAKELSLTQEDIVALNTLNEEITKASAAYGEEYGKILNPDGVTLNETAREYFLEMKKAERAVIDDISKVLYDKKIMHEVKILGNLVDESRPAKSWTGGGQGVSPRLSGWKPIEETNTGKEILKAYKTISRWEQDEFVRMLKKHLGEFRSARSWLGRAFTSYDETTERLISTLEKVKGKR